jgi:hypothetical protein
LRVRNGDGASARLVGNARLAQNVDMIEDPPRKLTPIGAS